MESFQNKKLKARENWRKVSSAVMIPEAVRERVRSYQKLRDDRNRTSSNSLVLDIQDTDTSNSDEPSWQRREILLRRITMAILYFLGKVIFETTFPSLDYRHYDPHRHYDPLLLSQIAIRLYELIIVVWTFWNLVCYICDRLRKDRKEKLILSGSYENFSYLVGLLGAIHVCICSTIQYANYELHENGRFTKNCMIFLFTLCLCYYRQLFYNRADETRLAQFLKKISTDVEYRFVFTHTILAIFSASWVLGEQLSFTSQSRDAQFGIFCAFIGVVWSILELIGKGKREKVKLRRLGRVWWFCYPDSNCTPFGTLTEIYGLISAIFQLIFSMVHYACFLLDVDNPIRLCLLPSVFLVCVACSTSQKNHPTQIISAERMFLLTNIGLEILSATFEQLSSPNKPRYALYGMLLAIAALIMSIWEIVDKGRREKVKWMRRGTWRWFYHPSPHYKPFGTLLDIYGLIGGIAQCIFSIVQYACYIRHMDNPIQLCLLPTIFYLCVSFSKLIGKSKTL